MFLSKTSVNRPILISVITIALVLMGILSYFNLPLNLQPEVDMPIITIQVIYPGAGPEEIETNITKKIEEAVIAIGGLDFVQSYVMANASSTICAFKMDKDIDIASQEIKDKIDAIAYKFPKDSKKPSIQKMDIGASAIVRMALVSKMSKKEAYEYVENNLKDEFSRLNGVSQVEISGGSEREIQIRFDKYDIQKYKLSPLQIVGLIKANNLNFPAGNIEKEGSQYAVKIESEFLSLDDIRNIQINTPVGVRRLKDIAKVVDTTEKLSQLAKFYKEETANQESAKLTTINLDIKRQSDANIVEVADRVNQKFEQLKAKLPKGMQFYKCKDMSVFVKDTVNDTLNAIYLGILFTAIVLYLFLHSLKTTLIVAISMPIALIGTFILADYSGFSLNVMSLMALSVSVGTLVTNSVIILENIDRLILMGEKKKVAADRGTAEIAVAVLASTLTNVVVFVPIATMESMVGQFFKEFGLMVTFVMFFSILIGFTITPMLSGLLLTENKKDKKSFSFGALFDKGLDRITAFYRIILVKIIDNAFFRNLTPILAIVLLLITFKVTTSSLGMGFMPFVDDGDIEITIEMPTYYDLDKTDQVFSRIEDYLKEFKDVESITTNIGKLGISQGENLGLIAVKLKENRTISSKAFVVKISDYLAKIPDALIKAKAKSNFSQGGQAAIQFEVYGEDLEKIKAIANQIKQFVIEDGGALNIDTDIRAGKPELKIIPNRVLLNDFGLSVRDISMTIRAYIEGIDAGNYRENSEEYSIVVKLDDADVNDVKKISNLPILTRKGLKKISDFAKIDYGTAPSLIKRKNKQKMHIVSCDAGSKSMGEIVKTTLKRVQEEINLPAGYSVDLGGNAKNMKESNKDFGKAFILAIVLTFLLIAGILESFIQAILIMATVPLSFIGVLWTLYLSGEGLNILSMMAGVMLIGIVVNNAILILDYANQLQNLGQTKYEAIIDAATTKLRAIIMATLASAIGMLPLALGLGSGAEMRRGMGLVSIGGLIVSAILTLFVIPAIYAQFTRSRRKDNQ